MVSLPISIFDPKNSFIPPFLTVDDKRVPGRESLVTVDGEEISSSDVGVLTWRCPTERFLVVVSFHPPGLRITNGNTFMKVLPTNVWCLSNSDLCFDLSLGVLEESGRVVTSTTP